MKDRIASDDPGDEDDKERRKRKGMRVDELFGSGDLPGICIHLVDGVA
jgi:hypothetical protein